MSAKPPPPQIDLARAYVAKMDAAIEGSGGDLQTYIVACKLVEFGLNATEASTVLKEYNTRCKPEWSEEGLARKLRMAFNATKPNPKFIRDGNEVANRGEFPEVKSTQKWPKVNEELRRKITGGGIGLSDLGDTSPVRFEHPSTKHIVDSLFPGDPLICVGLSKDRFWTNRISWFRDRLGYAQLIVPSPMSKRTGKIQDPRPGGPTESAHTKDNTGGRRYAVVEFDKGSTDEHAALLWHLSNYAPLVMAVHSGGKSLHGWFRVAGEDEQRVFRFYRYAVWIGADRATFLKSQFVRMPDGTRDNGNRQTVHYFDPSKIGGVE